MEQSCSSAASVLAASSDADGSVHWDTVSHIWVGSRHLLLSGQWNCPGWQGFAAQVFGSSDPSGQSWILSQYLKQTPRFV